MHPVIPPGISPGEAVMFGLEDRALLTLAQTLRECAYRFTTVSPATHALVNGRAGNRWARDIVDVFGWSRAFRPELLPPSIFALMRAAAVLKSTGNGGWRSTVRFSTLPGGSRDELLVHSAFPTQATDAVFFGPDSYRFNQAILQFLAHESHAVHRALDIGTGTGAGAIAIAREHPDAVVIASDINGEALRLARINAMLANRSNVSVQHSNLFDEIDGNFDLIVANPPFLLDTEQRVYRHGGGNRGEGLSLAILESALSRLSTGGSLLLYTGVAIVDGIDPLLAVARELPAHLTWSYREIDPDIFGEELAHSPYENADRIAAVLLKVTAVPALQNSSVH